MIVTAETPKYEGETVEFGGCLLELADVIGWDEVGAQVKCDQDAVCLIVDSTAYPNKKIWLEPEDAEHLAARLIARAAEVRELRR